MRIRRPACALLLMVGLLRLVPATAISAPQHFVTSDGTRLLVNGAPWKAIGVNFWDMNAGKAIANDVGGCYYQHADLDSYFDLSFARIKALTKATVVRTFAFREQYTAQGRDWSSTDKLMYYAQKHDLRIIPVLGDQYATCGIPYRPVSWYACAEPGCTPGYRQPNHWGGDWRSYVVDVVRRYRDNPTIAFWQLMNEPMHGPTGVQAPPGHLVSFTRDMVRAIREDGGDANHLINLGTSQASSNANAVGQLIDCPSGGCQDLTEYHDYSRRVLAGTPLPTSVLSRIRLSNSYDPDYYGGITTLPIDSEWTELKVTVPTAPSRLAHLYWSVHLYVPPSSAAWTMYVDDVILKTITGPKIYSFEASTDGFEADGAALSHTTKQVKTGFGALRVDVPAGVTEVRLTPPILPSQTQEISLFVKLAFTAPAPESSRGLAGTMHTATIARGAPFFSGETGIPAMVPGGNDVAPLFKPECVPNATLDQRAQTFEQMLAVQTDDEHRSAGIVFWDWKDPSLLSTREDGSLVTDPMTNCYSITPADPAVKVIAKYASQTVVDPLPPPTPLGPEQTVLVLLKKPPAVLGAGSTVPLQARLTRGGDAVAGARVDSTGACVGSGVTNALGIANFSCKATGTPGGGSVVIGTESAGGDTDDPLPVVVQRAIRTSAATQVAERTGSIPLTLGFKSSDGRPLEGATWRVEECGSSGTITSTSDVAVVTASCPASRFERSGPILMHVSVTDTDDVVTITPITGLLFDRVYYDSKTEDCIGIAATDGWVGGTDYSKRCDASGAGAPSSWFSFRVPLAERATAFRPVDSKMIVTASAPTGRRVIGEFEYVDPGSRDFVAVVVRKDGTKAFSSP